MPLNRRHGVVPNTGIGVCLCPCAVTRKDLDVVVLNDGEPGRRQYPAIHRTTETGAGGLAEQSPNARDLNGVPWFANPNAVNVAISELRLRQPPGSAGWVFRSLLKRRHERPAGQPGPPNLQPPRSPERDYSPLRHPNFADWQRPSVAVECDSSIGRPWGFRACKGRRGSPLSCLRTSRVAPACGSRRQKGCRAPSRSTTRCRARRSRETAVWSSR